MEVSSIASVSEEQETDLQGENGWVEDAARLQR